MTFTSISSLPAQPTSDLSPLFTSSSPLAYLVAFFWLAFQRLNLLVFLSGTSVPFSYFFYSWSWSHDPLLKNSAVCGPRHCCDLAQLQNLGLDFWESCLKVRKLLKSEKVQRLEPCRIRKVIAGRGKINSSEGQGNKPYSDVKRYKTEEDNGEAWSW